jgi:hypothetical protein
MATQPPMPPAGDAMPPTGASDSVMIQMPKAAFDMMASLVMELAAGVQDLQTSVEMQKSGMAESPAGGPAGGPAGAPMGGEGPMGAMADEEFLKELAKEGSM